MPSSSRTRGSRRSGRRTSSSDSARLLVRVPRVRVSQRRLEGRARYRQSALSREAQPAECAFPLRRPCRMRFSVECAFPQLGKRRSVSWKSTFYVCRLTKRRILEVPPHAKAHSVNGTRNQPNGTAARILDQNKSATRATSAMGVARGCRARSGIAGPRWVTDGAGATEGRRAPREVRHRPYGPIPARRAGGCASLAAKRQVEVARRLSPTICASRERYPMTAPPIRWGQHRETLLSAVRSECSSWLIGHARGYTEYAATSAQWSSKMSG